MKNCFTSSHGFRYRIIVPNVAQNYLNVIFVIGFLQPTPVIVRIIPIKGNNVKTLFYTDFRKIGTNKPGGTCNKYFIQLEILSRLLH